MIYSELILALSESLLRNFDTVYHSAEIVTNDAGEKMPVIVHGDEWISLAPTDQKETLYIRRNSDDEVQEEVSIGSCRKSYKMRTALKIVFFKDHVTNHGEILFKLMQSVLISGVKLRSIIQDKFALQKEESTGDYTFGPDTAYFAIIVNATWYLYPDICDTEFCADIENPLKKELCQDVVA